MSEKLPEKHLEELFEDEPVVEHMYGPASRGVLDVIQAARLVAQASKLQLSDDGLVSLAVLIRDQAQFFKERYNEPPDDE